MSSHDAFLAEVLAWPSFQKSVAADPERWNNEFVKIRDMFSALVTGARPDFYFAQLQRWAP